MTVICGAGIANAAPTHPAPKSAAASTTITSQYLLFADPYPFGYESLHVTAIAPGVLRMVLGPYCPTPQETKRCSGGPIEEPFRVGWVNLSTGAVGSITMPYSGAPVTVRTGRGNIGIGAAFGIPSVPGSARINA